ncbi:MAG: cysteine desulfurase family protein [Zetaproteobacteria bacterium]|nr:cysteine desulfurase family protein [Zetaproteobacteria bacterium]
MKQVYADYNATYPCSDQHLDTVTRVIRKCQGNPSSIHSFGRDAKLLLEQSRSQVAALFGAPRQNVFFTSGATEANNLALHSSIANAKAMMIQTLPHVVITEGEHPSILAPVEAMVASQSLQCDFAKLTPSGRVDIEDLLQLIRPESTFVSFFFVNSETGAIHDIGNLTRQIKSSFPKVHIHVDCVQGLGKLDLTWLHTSEIDSASGSAHKLGGLKGIGCLYHKKPRTISPMIYGGGQEMSMRSGTENMPGLISFGLRAKEIIHSPTWWKPGVKVCTKLYEQIQNTKGIYIHGDFKTSTQTTLNLHFEDLSVEKVMLHFDTCGIAISRGSACSSGSSNASRTLLSMGYSEDIAKNSLRISFGADSIPEHADFIATQIQALIEGNT